MTTLIDLGKLRFSFSGDWSSSTTYETNDIVKYGGNVYVYTYGLKTSGHLPTETDFWALMVEGIKFKGAYATGTAYKVGDGVAHGGKVYIAIKDTTGNTPPNVTYWSQFADGIQYEGAYSNVAQYQRNDVVQYGASAYIAKQDTTGNLPTASAFWDKLVDGISATGVWSSVTAYVPGDLVAYGANIYKAIANNTNQLPIDSNGTLNSVNWQLFNSGIRSRGDWTTATEYYINDVVIRGGSTYICVVRNASTAFETDLAANKWQKFNSGVRWRGAWGTGTAYLRDDVVKDAVGTAYIANVDHTAAAEFITDKDAGKWTAMVVGGADVLPVFQSGDTGQSLTVKSDGSGIDWIGATASDKVFWVAPHGTDTATSGRNQSTPFASIKYACQQAPTGSTIFVKTGTYSEQLPIVVPANVAIVGDNQRTVIVQPKTGLSDDGTTPNNQSTMFQMSNGSILNKMTFTGMTGWVPGTTASNVTTSTIKGVVVGFNPASPITHKSPYVLECAFIGSGAIGALIDGTVHATGAKTMIFHGYTVINDNGIGYWVKDGGKAEIVSCFTYYCYFGYTASGGGFIRALNGNNSYGTWGATSRGFDVNETPVTGALLGQQLNFLYGGGNINVGDTVTSATGSATVTNVQTTANKVYVQNATGTFTSGQALTFTSGGTGTVANGALENQKGFVLVLNNLTAMPKPGQSIQLTGDQYAYVVQSTTGTYTDTSSIITVVLAQEKPTGSASGTVATLRSKYSQIRLTGHDFLSIGTGGVATTNYPGEPTQPAAQGNETDEAFPGRVFYVSTDQDGNFRVGEYFRIDQATGRATLNASAFDLAGLTSLRLGSIGAQLGETINEFSSDGTLFDNSNTAVPTEQAVKTYVDNNATPIGGVIRWPQPTRTKYLRCDGGVYPKSAYPTLASLLGNIDEPLRWSPLREAFWSVWNPTSDNFRFHARNTTDEYVYKYDVTTGSVYRVRAGDQSVVISSVNGAFGSLSTFAPFSNANHSHNATTIYKDRYLVIGGSDATSGRAGMVIFDLTNNTQINGRFVGASNSNTKVYANSTYLVAHTIADNTVEWTSATPTGSMSFTSVSTPTTPLYGALVGTKAVFTSAANWSSYFVVDLIAGTCSALFNSHLAGQAMVPTALFGVSDDTTAVFCGNSTNTYFTWRSDTERFGTINIPDQQKVQGQRIEYFNNTWMLTGYWLDAPATGSSFTAVVYTSNDGINWENFGLHRAATTTSTATMPIMPIIGNTFVGIRPLATMTDANAMMYNRFPYDRTTQFMVPLITATAGAYPLIKAL